MRGHAVFTRRLRNGTALANRVSPSLDCSQEVAWRLLALTCYICLAQGVLQDRDVPKLFLAEDAVVPEEVTTA